MEKALQAASASSQSEVPTTPTKSLNNISDPTSSPISTMLTGIPKALLEKVCTVQHIWCIELKFVRGLSYQVTVFLRLFKNTVNVYHHEYDL